MEFLKDRRVIALLGGGLALIAGIAIAWFIVSRSHPPTEPPPATDA